MPKTVTSSDDVAQVMWHRLTPNDKKKIKLNVFNSSDRGMKEAFHRMIGVNLSNLINIRLSEMTLLQERIQQFFNKDYVSRVTPMQEKPLMVYLLGDNIFHSIFQY